MLAREYPDLYIDGGWRQPDSTQVFEVVSPSSGKPIGHVPSASKADIDAAVTAAHRAFYETDWPRRPVHQRAELCRTLAAALAERQEEFAELIVAELGCTKFLADVYEAAAPTLHWNYAAEVGENYKFSEVRISDLSPLADRGRRHRAVRRQEPRGQGARGRRGDLLRLQLRAAVRGPEGRSGAGRRMHRRGQGPGAESAGDLRDGRSDHRGRVSARSDQHRGRGAGGVRLIWSVTRRSTW